MIRHRGIRHFVIVSLLVAVSITFAACGRSDRNNFGNGQSALNGGGFGDGNGSGWNGVGNAGWGGDGTGGAGGAGYGTGSGTGSGTGTGNKRLGDVTMFFMQDADDHPGKRHPGLPYWIKISGPTQIYALSCNKYVVSTVNLFGVPTPHEFDEPMPLELGDDGTGVNQGAFFLDSNCRQAAAGATMAPGQHTRVFYYQSVTARTALLKAELRTELYLLIGRFGVNVVNNPKYFTQLGINFEDMYYRGGDMDFNDSVVCLTESDGSTLYMDGDGKTIRSHANQTVRFSVDGRSACDSRVMIRIVSAEGRVLQEVSIGSTLASNGVNLNFQAFSRMDIAFYSVGGCQSGRWMDQHDPSVRVTNRCRTAADEGQRWN